MSLIRYRGTLASLRGAIGRRMADGRVSLRGAPRDVPAADLERPRYWVKADGAWAGPFTSWEKAARWLADLAHVWGDDGLAHAVRCAEATETGWTGYGRCGTRVRLVPGGTDKPVDSYSDC